MASGTLVEGGGDVPGVKNRWIENKVYKRKVFRKGGIKNNNGSSQQPPSSQTAVTDGNNNQQQPQQPAASDVSTSIQHQQVVAVKENGEGAPTENGSVQTSESHLNIHLSSMSKQEIREVKLKLVDELEQVRNLLKQVEAKELELNGVTGDATVATAGDATVGDATVGDDGCTGVSAVGVEGHPGVGVGVGVDVESYNHSDLSANEVVDNGVGSKTMPEFSLDDVDGDRRMIPEFSLNDDGVDRRTMPEFTLNDGGEQRMSLDDGADRRMIPEFSLDDGGDRSTIPEISLDNGGGRIMVPEFSLDNGGGNGMIPEVTVKTFGSRGMVSEISLDNGGSGRVMSEVNLGNGGGTRRRISEVSSVGKREPPRSLHQLRVSVMENSHGGLAEYADKEKRTPKANQYYRNSDFIVGKERLPPPNKKSKINGSKKHGRVGERDSGFNWIKHNSPIFKNCSSLLTKLMKHKHGWVFNAPVDVEALGLRDYFYIIKHPMDLGTVKERLNTNWYRSPKEFAEDVRLTFRNAMTYNPAGQDVHVMADILSQIFEDRWAALGTEYELNSWLELYHEFSLPTPVMNKTPRALMPPPEIGRYLDRLELTPQPVKSKPKLATHGSSGRGTALKKPKAKDQNKRDMTYEEKQKLSKNLQSLPTEKLDAVVEIMRRRTSSLVQNDDSIEVDIDSIDTETLWELDRFVTNYKKSLSKYKRRAELAMKAREEAERNTQQKNHAPVTVEVSKETKSAADEKNTGLPPPLKADKQQDNSSRSSSSSSSSSDSGSSSSDSDSDSSSGSDAGNSPKT